MTASFVTSDHWNRAREAFDQAARWFVQSTLAGDGHWDEPALGEWTVRDLVGHTSRALVTIETYLGKPANAVKVASPADYFRLILSTGGAPAAVAQRGREAGAALGEHPANAVAEIAERVLARVRAESGGVLLTTLVGGMRLADYLPTRTFELTVHTCDLATALGAPLEVPPAAATESIEVLGGLASSRQLAGSLLLAATGRQSLPHGFSVL